MHDDASCTPNRAPRKPRLNKPRERKPSELGHIEPDLFSELETARRLSIQRSTLRHWRLTGDGPPFVRLGRMIRYDRRAVFAWIAARTSDGANGPQVA